MQHDRLRIVRPARAKGARDRRGNATAHAAIGDIEHQGDERDDQRHAGQRVRAQTADKNAVGDGNEDLREHERRRGASQQKQAPANRRGQQRM